MGTLYDKDEIYTATEVVRNFSSILKKIVNKEQKRAVIVKNNKFEAVILHIDEYEKFKDAYDILQKIYENKLLK
ncbi:MAG: type II toxin-antitoxin system Phd/YefM family antitoxin [Epsilonproteobacteria bacterium]|jgi:PHD/YefM family antitoxin component YafN of YafNO toxin-antitoxin module|nr:type II toxin-antitoxin system Phd/YefM family antitoxin [Campylobacterota bacterium]